MKKLFIFLSFILLNSLHSKSQDARVTDYSQMPVLINPANAGNFDGAYRAILYYNNIHDNNLSNNLFNLNMDYNLPKSKLGLGVNYMKTGSSSFNMSGDYIALSLSK